MSLKAPISWQEAQREGSLSSCMILMPLQQEVKAGLLWPWFQKMLPYASEIGKSEPQSPHMEMCQGHENPQLDQGCGNKIRVWEGIGLEEKFFAENCADALRGWMECYVHCFWSVGSGLQQKHPEGFFWVLRSWGQCGLELYSCPGNQGCVYQMWAMLSLVQAFSQEDQGLTG